MASSIDTFYNNNKLIRNWLYPVDCQNPNRTGVEPLDFNY